MPFLFNVEIIYPQWYNIQLRFTSLNINYLGWIISDIKQRGIEYICLLSAFPSMLPYE